MTFTLNRALRRGFPLVRHPLGWLLALAAILALLSMPAGRAAGQRGFETLPIYALQRPDVTADYAASLAASVFDLRGEVEQLEDRFVVTDGTRRVEVHASSGGIWFADDEQLWNPDLQPTLPDPQFALALAEEFLYANELLPSSQEAVAQFATFGGTYKATFDAEQQVRGPTEKLDVQVIYDVSLIRTDLPIVGGGSEFNVTLGNDGALIGYSGVWREIEGVVDEWSVVPQAEADEEFLENVQGIQLLDYSSSLAYYSAPPTEAQSFLYPVYVYQGTGQANGQTFPLRSVLVPATTFSLDAEITQPASGLTVAPSDPVQLEGQALEGTPPYTFEWESNLDGPLGTGESLAVQLSAQPHSGMGAATHSIQLTVTDANGMVATDATLVTVQGWQLHLPLVMNGAEAGSPTRTDAPQAPLADDWTLEAGASWIGVTGGLNSSQNNAAGFLNGLASAGWAINFNWGDNDAWHSDWTTDDDSYVDAADFVFYTGHADVNGWQTAATGGDGWMSWDEAAPAHSPADLWGQNDNDWIVIAACGPLEDDILSPGGGDVFRWANAFDGLHQLLGYGAVTYEHPSEGATFTNYMRSGHTIIDSWFRTARDIQPATNTWAAPYGPTIWVGVMYVGQHGIDPANDHLHGYGPVSPDPTNPTYYVAMWTTT